MVKDDYGKTIPDRGITAEKTLITTHIHHWSCSKSDDNLGAVYRLGTSEDDALSQYANETPSTHARRSQSLIVMKRGYIRNLERIETDWKVELGEYAAKARICRESA